MFVRESRSIIRWAADKQYMKKTDKSATCKNQDRNIIETAQNMQYCDNQCSFESQDR